MFESYCREKLGPLTLRLALGLVCVYHGYLKIMASGGTAWAPGLPTTWQFLLSWGEFAGGLAVLAGFRCRYAALVVLIVTAGQVAWQHGWGTIRLPIPTLEPILVVLFMSLALLFLGAGELALGNASGGSSGAAPRPPRKKG